MSCSLRQEPASQSNRARRGQLVSARRFFPQPDFHHAHPPTQRGTANQAARTIRRVDCARDPRCVVDRTCFVRRCGRPAVRDPDALRVKDIRCCCPVDAIACCKSSAMASGWSSSRWCGLCRTLAFHHSEITPVSRWSRDARTRCRAESAASSFVDALLPGALPNRVPSTQRAAQLLRVSNRRCDVRRSAAGTEDDQRIGSRRSLLPLCRVGAPIVANLQLRVSTFRSRCWTECTRRDSTHDRRRFHRATAAAMIGRPARCGSTMQIELERAPACIGCTWPRSQ